MQSLYPDQFDDLMAQVRQIASVVNRTVPPIAKNWQVETTRTSAASPAAD
jgi:hypothetical protein